MYIKLCNYLQIAYGEGIEEQFSFNLNQFCNKYQFPVLKTFNGMQFLDRQGIITLSQEFSEKVTVQFILESKEVIRYISLNPADENILLAMLRTYSGIYEIPANLNLTLIAKKANTTESAVIALLQKLKEKEIIDYQAKNNDATILFNEVREDERTINRISKYLENQNHLKIAQLKSVLEYVNEKNRCKSQLILDYFGETTSSNCGICSYCIQQNKPEVSPLSLTKEIIALLKTAPLNSREIQFLTKKPTDAIIFALKQLLEHELIVVKPNNQYTLKS